MKILPISFAPSFLLNATRGALIGAAIFLVFALVMAALAAHSDKSIVKTKIMDAIKTSAIQRPGKWDVTDKRGIDTFTDCLVLQASILDHGNFLQDMFDSLVYKRKLSGTSEPKMHRCDVLVDVLYDTNVESPGVRSYSRYWWGSAVTTRIVLGMTGLSVDAYRQTIWILSFASLLIFILVFFLCYGRVFFVFLPFFLSSVFGYGLLILGQSIAHAPEFIGGLLLLSAYGLGNVQRLSFGVRPFGIVCSAVYASISI
ncbi:MAG: hypothetical protein M3495_14650 [Pseudomonadota bacterium]|nr:hypothetical protein [Gammaproteobacteria bacterium]MDQ3582762.1 hypothetical protein [Pseudomonadota bacterium]